MKNTWKIAVSVSLAATALAATAMPTKKQLLEAQRIVNELTADDIRALNAKQKTAGEVAAAHLDHVDKAETEAGKYLLLQGAFRLYVRGEDYDAAADVLRRMKADVSDVPPEVMVALIDGEMRKVAHSKAPKVLAIYNEAKYTIKYSKRLTAAEAEAEKRGTSKSFKQLAECHVHLGNWKRALETFARARVTAAKWELDQTSVSDCDALKAAEYWYNYEAEDAEPFRAHAAELYRRALECGLITSSLHREVIEKRIRDMGFTIANGWAIPEGFSPPLEKSLKLADGVEMTFCACKPGSFTLARKLGWVKHRMLLKVNITRSFWAAKFFLSARQYAAFNTNDNVDIAVKKLEQTFPGDQIVMFPRQKEALEFISWLNKKYGSILPAGYVFRLPTEAEARYVSSRNGGQCHFRDLKKKNLNPKDFSGLKVMDMTSSTPGQWGVVKISYFDIPFFTADHVNSKSDLTGTKEETDPIRLGRSPLCLKAYNIVTAHSPNDRGYVRIVIAPDLIAEKTVQEKK